MSMQPVTKIEDSPSSAFGAPVVMPIPEPQEGPTQQPQVEAPSPRTATTSELKVVKSEVSAAAAPKQNEPLSFDEVINFFKSSYPPYSGIESKFNSHMTYIKNLDSEKRQALCRELREKGLGPLSLKVLGFTAKELKDVGCTVELLHYARFSALELKKEGFTAKELRAPIDEYHGIYESIFSDAIILGLGYSASELKEAGFSKKDLIDAGYDAEEVEKLYTAVRMPDTIPNASELTYTPAEYLGGSGEMHSFIDGQGSYWLFKPAQDKEDTAKKEQKFRAYIQEAAYRVQQIVSPESAIPVGVGELPTSAETGAERRFGAYQYFVPGTRQLKDEDLNKLSAGQVQRLLGEHVTDWLLANFDTHVGNFIMYPNGDIFGIDKEQAFRFINTPEAKEMSLAYKPNGYPPIYNQLFTMIKDREIPKKHLRILDIYIKRVEAISDEQYREIFRPYAEALYPGNREQSEALLEKIVERKRNLRAAYREFIRIQLHFNPDQILSTEPDRPIPREQLPKMLAHFDEYEASYANDWEDIKEFEADAEQRSIFDRAMRSMVTTENFYMHMPSDVLLAVLNEGRQGRFKQLMETGASKGGDDERQRISDTIKIFGVDTSALEPKDYQKYGHLGRATEVDRYGGAIVTFKKHRLKESTTFTGSDSGYEADFIASRVNNPRLTAFFTQLKTLLPAMKTYMEEGNILKFLKFIKSWYIELQYHGELTVSDIERVVFTEIPDNPEIFPKLNELNIPYMIKSASLPNPEELSKLQNLADKTIPLRFELDTDPTQDFIEFLAANGFTNCSFTLKQEPGEAIRKLLMARGYTYKVRA